MNRYTIYLYYFQQYYGNIEKLSMKFKVEASSYDMVLDHGARLRELYQADDYEVKE